MQENGFSMVVLGQIKSFKDNQEIFNNKGLGGRLFTLEGKEVFLDNFDDSVNVVIEIRDVISYFKETVYYERYNSYRTEFKINTPSEVISVPLVEGFTLVLYNNVIVPETYQYHSFNLNTPLISYTYQNDNGGLPGEDYNLNDKTRLYLQTLSSLSKSKRPKVDLSIIRRNIEKRFHN